MTARDTLLAYANDWHGADCAGNFSPFAECSCGLAEWVTKAEAEATAAAEQRLRERIEREPLYDETDRIVTMSGELREVRTPADAAEAIKTRILALFEDTPPPASPRQGEPVAGAWDEAKAAMPSKRWHVTLTGGWEDGWDATAHGYTHGGKAWLVTTREPGWMGQPGGSPDPATALHALAAALSEPAEAET